MEAPPQLQSWALQHFSIRCQKKFNNYWKVLRGPQRQNMTKFAFLYAIIFQ